MTRDPSSVDLVQCLLALGECPAAERASALSEIRSRYPTHGELIDRCVDVLESGVPRDKLASMFVEIVTPTLEPVASPAGDLPKWVGPYRILATLGIGGMGTVFLADQKSPVRRRVALKVIKLGMDSKQVLARFGLERQALAMMSHPAIAKVFDAGVTEQGQPYFVMEFVEGIPLDEYCDQNRLSVRERIAVFQQVCRGVHHAHQKGVLHRDLKPGNILVSRKDDQPVVKIIDFGLARATDQQLIDQTIYTEKGQLIGTPEYMSPEQAGGSALEIDTRTDIYSLGVVLYQLLTGELPFASVDLRRAGLLELQRIIREKEPLRPSSRLSSVGEGATHSAERRRLSRVNLLKTLRGDLDWIVMRAMAKEAPRRYESASSLAQDLDRYLEFEPVEAGPPGARYRLRKFLRKYRLQVVAVAMILITAIVGALVSVVYAMKVTEMAERFDLLTIDDRVRSARDEQARLFPAWPNMRAKLQKWRFDRGAVLRDERARIKRTLKRLRENLDAEHRVTPHDSLLVQALGDAQAELEKFFEPDGIFADVEQRLVWSRRIEELTLHHPNAGPTWEEAANAIAKADDVVASRLYGYGPESTWDADRKAIRAEEKENGWTPKAEHPDRPLRLVPQMGLVPIGMNPKTKLWEFYHLRSAWDPDSGVDPGTLPIPSHDPQDGTIRIGEATGIVFVLLPGGLFRMGSQSKDSKGPNYDAKYANYREPVISVTVPAFFMARHELTQGQWACLSPRANNSFGGRNPTWPVQQVSWNEFDSVLRGRHGLKLPTDAEWEYACRGSRRSGFTTWFPGNRVSDLDGFVNLWDQSVGHSRGRLDTRASFNDGHPELAPVGTFEANDFGMHDMHGNVFEWTEDLLRPDSENRRYRGGAYSSQPVDARSASRFSGAPTVESSRQGVRAARRLYY